MTIMTHSCMIGGRGFQSEHTGLALGSDRYDTSMTIQREKISEVIV